MGGVAAQHRRSGLARSTGATAGATRSRMCRAGRPVPLPHAPRRPRHSGHHAPRDNAGAAETATLARL
eukprot:9486776-Heterocapsa_arctica.AAC.1